ncbi:Acyl-CoA N-acyltransferase protein [Quillaja saponaria]|uniref:Acyl-CoA N-acyltransferase protein n=1 Tax=Quillaja saponaria TaxID=32244 RepID=A0AAD7LJV0_QUISA|nr:Acyl-CoA N-acyltransferase protein [Quillaja saponaria]
MVAVEVTAGIRMHVNIEQRMLEGYRSKSMELKWARRRNSKNSITSEEKLLRPTAGALVPFYISTDPKHINPDELQNLYAACNHSCYRFPNHVDDGGRVEPVDIHKLRIALSHSSVLVSVFCKPRYIVEDNDDIAISTTNSPFSIMGVGNFLQRVMPLPVSPFNGQLVGFGRAISDYGLTASIYDVMVIPSFRRMGIGQTIVKRIVRMLTSRDIYDIAALCSDNERLFFKACGFGDDILGSTTMMYTRSTSTTYEVDQRTTRAGRRFLLIPPVREPCGSSQKTVS